MISGIRGGDEAAMTALYDRYSCITYSVALRVLGDTGAAEDVMQEVLMQLWRNPKLFDSSRGNIGAWLAVVSRHRAIDFLRKRRPETDLENVVLASSDNMENAIERNVLIGKIRSTMTALPEEQRRALEMNFFEGLTHSEIAEKTSQPLGTVKTRIRSALTTIRKGVRGPNA
jgi:RNA polymerase sigma-70 factor (ECF subfamily)